MKYIVHTEHETFEFDNGFTALLFADEAAQHSTETAIVNIQVIDDNAEYHIKEDE